MPGLLGRLRRSEHRFCQENLSGYLDQRLTGRARERVERHLQECARCRWDLETLQQTVALLRAMPRPRPPRSFAIPETGPAPSLPFWMRSGTYVALRVATAAATVVFLAAVAGNLALWRGWGGPGAVPAAAPAVFSGPAAATPPAQAPLAATAVPAAEGLPSATPMPRMLGTIASMPAPAVAGPAGPSSEPTLSAEEVARKASAPAGMGAGPGGEATDAAGAAAQGPVAAAAPTQPADEDARAREVSQPTVMPEESGALASPAAEPSDQTAAARSEPWGAAPPAGTAAADAYGAAPQADEGICQRLALRPTAARGLVASAAALAALVAATLWLRAVRARWR